MEFSLSKSYEILERTPRVYKALLSGLSHDWVYCNEGGETWSAFDIVGHLIHGEKTDWIPRAEIIRGDAVDKTFVPFDMTAHELNSVGKSLEALLDEFEKLRAENLVKLKAMKLTAKDLEKKGIHPDLGEVTLRALISTWTVHDLSHINQISRAMVKHYKEDVGAWRKYISIIRNN